MALDFRADKPVLGSGEIDVCGRRVRPPADGVSNLREEGVNDDAHAVRETGRLRHGPERQEPMGLTTGKILY